MTQDLRTRPSVHPRFGETRYYLGVPVVRHADGLFRDQHGTVFGVGDADATMDDTVRLGVGPLSLPQTHPLTDAARFHDYAYGSPAYQATTTRAEADAVLKRHLLLLAGADRLTRTQAYVLAALARVFGGLFWEGRR